MPITISEAIEVLVVKAVAFYQSGRSLDSVKTPVLRLALKALLDSNGDRDMARVAVERFYAKAIECTVQARDD